MPSSLVYLKSLFVATEKRTNVRSVPNCFGSCPTRPSNWILLIARESTREKERKREGGREGKIVKSTEKLRCCLHRSLCKELVVEMPRVLSAAHSACGCCWITITEDSNLQRVAQKLRLILPVDVSSKFLALSHTTWLELAGSRDRTGVR